MHLAVLLAQSLDPVLTASVFAPGQTGLHPDEARTGEPYDGGPWPAGSGSVIWCAPYDDVHERFPAWPQASDQDQGVGACVDLVVEVERGVLVRVDLESLRLDETFLALGRPTEAAAARGLVGTRAQHAAPVLGELLTRLLAG